jgi:hypothetical protein
MTPDEGLMSRINSLDAAKQAYLELPQHIISLSRKTSRFFMAVSLAVDTGDARNTPAFLVTIH